MISPAQIKNKVMRHWNSGALLRALLIPDGEDAERFPWSIPFKKPSAVQWLTRFESLREDVDALRSASKETGRKGYRVEWQTVQHRKLGEQYFPTRVILDTPDDALACVGKSRAATRCLARVKTLSTRFPELKPWCMRQPQTVLHHDEDWDRIVRVLDWFVRNPRSRLYLRQVDIPGVDTKFVESRRRLLATLLEQLLPASAMTDSTPLRKEAWFEHRFGLRYDVPRVRARGPALAAKCGFDDATLGTDALARTPIADRVFIVENKVTGLAFPNVPESLVLMGLGYGVSVLEHVPWLAQAELYYWGDIDTHGLAILSRLRSAFPNARSFLMEERDLREWQALAVKEERAASASEDWLQGLTPDEQRVARALLPGGICCGMRLEQERIPMSYVSKRLQALIGG